MFTKGDKVDVTAKAGDIFSDFTGTVVSNKGFYIEVKDQDDDVWSCNEDQVVLAGE